MATKGFCMATWGLKMVTFGFCMDLWGLDSHLESKDGHYSHKWLHEAQGAIWGQWMVT